MSAPGPACVHLSAFEHTHAYTHATFTYNRRQSTEGHGICFPLAGMKYSRAATNFDFPWTPANPSNKKCTFPPRGLAFGDDGETQSSGHLCVVSREVRREAQLVELESAWQSQTAHCLYAHSRNAFGDIVYCECTIAGRWEERTDFVTNKIRSPPAKQQRGCASSEGDCPGVRTTI